MINLRIFFLAALFSLAALPAKADILLSDFSNLSAQYFGPMGISWSSAGLDQYIQNTGSISMAPVGGGNPAGDGYFVAALPGAATLSFSSLNYFSLTAKVDLGNASSILHVILYDNTFTKVATSTFSASSFSSSFSTQIQPLSFTGLGTVGAIKYWRVEGDGITSDAFRFSFDNLAATAVPEPSSYAICAVGFLAAWIARREIRKRRPAPARRVTTG